MIGPYPFFGFPYPRRPYYPIHNSNRNPSNLSGTVYSPSAFPNPERKAGNVPFTPNCGGKTENIPSFPNSSVSQKKSFHEEETDPCFEIFGLTLHFDDLLLLALLFFLYQEEVKDTYLYVALILLLLS